MKTKRNLLVATLVLLMMVTAVGYAAWSDTLVVNGTVATGTFDVQFLPTPSTTQTLANADATITATTGLQGTETNDRIAIAIAKAQPNDVFTVTVVTKNVGTVKAKLSTVVLSNIADNNFTVTMLDGATNALASGYTTTLEAEGTKTYVITVTMKDFTGDYGTTENFTIDFTYDQLTIV